MSKTAALQLQLAPPPAPLDEGDHAIAAWWEGQHYAASAAAGRPAVSPVYDVTVSPREPLRAALDRCREGGSVLLLPGAYEGGVVLSKEVHLFGRGKATLSRAAKEGPVITSTALAATLDGLVVRLGPHAGEGEGHVCILITAGSLLVRHCDVSSRSWGSICVRGASASPTILGCKVHGSKKAGITFYGGSQGRVEGCDVAGSGSFGLEIKSSDPLILGNEVHGSSLSGLCIKGHDRAAKLEGNRVFENGDDGIEICDGLSPSLIANDIHNNTFSGVSLKGGGQARLERNSIRANGLSGIFWAEGFGDLILIGNTIRDHAGGLGYGVFSHASPFGYIVWGDNNKFSGNEKDLVSPSVWQPAAAPAAHHQAPVAPPPATPAEANLLRELECVVCKEIMLRPFSVCQHGHASVCTACYEQLNECPVCRGDLLSPPSRILPLEGMAKDLLVPCPYAAIDGCSLNALRYADAGVHAAICDWRKVLVGEAVMWCFIAAIFFSCS